MFSNQAPHGKPTANFGKPRVFRACSLRTLSSQTGTRSRETALKLLLIA